MACDHSRVRLAAVAAEPKHGVSGRFVVLTLSKPTCSLCGIELELAATRVVWQPSKREITIALQPASAIDPENLRCPHCRCRLFGRPMTPEAVLDRESIIIDVQCGMRHRVVYADGVVIGVMGGTLEVLDEQQG